MKNKKFLLSFLLLNFLLFLFCAGDQVDKGAVQAVSVTGENLYSLSSGNDSLLTAINVQLENDPENLELLHAKAREYRNYQRYNEAIEIYSQCIRLAPGNPVFYRRRGHRHISTRKFANAIADLEMAQRINRLINRTEEDLLKREWDAFVWRLDFEIWYHLGLAYYLNGEYENAYTTYSECVRAARDDNARVAGLYWQYLTLRKLEMDEVAEKLLEDVNAGMEVNTNLNYLNLLRFFKGELTEEEILDPENYTRLDIVGYGVGAYRFFNGDEAGAREMFEKVMEPGYWPGFGYIASEVELAGK